MREDQKDYLSILVKENITNMVVPFMADYGVTKLEDFLPNVQDFVSEGVEISFGSILNEQELDELIAFNKKYAEKSKEAVSSIQTYSDAYFKKNEKVIEAMLKAI